ncbi:MAG TPA: hypothetical protein VJ577_11460 [Burkholderiaceae bacterium]|nr:hypothetical protein [Burkholderiaceae bacterium]
MKLRNIIIGAAVAASLQGCLVFIPGKVIDSVTDGITGAEGSHCVSESAKIGDRVRMPYNGVGVIKSLSGTSIRCTSPDMPIRAMIVMEGAGRTAPVDSMPDEGNDCLPASYKVGDRVHVGGKDWGTVKAVYGTSSKCPYADMPMRVKVAMDDEKLTMAPDEGNACVPAGFRIGTGEDLGGGRHGVVRALFGPSAKCPYADRPVRALIVPN